MRSRSPPGRTHRFANLKEAMLAYHEAFIRSPKEDTVVVVTGTDPVTRDDLERALGDLREQFRESQGAIDARVTDQRTRIETLAGQLEAENTRNHDLLVTHQDDQALHSGAHAHALRAWVLNTPTLIAVLCGIGLIAGLGVLAGLVRSAYLAVAMIPFLGLAVGYVIYLHMRLHRVEQRLRQTWRIHQARRPAADDEEVDDRIYLG